MSKGLEALEELKFQVGNITFHTRDLQITTIRVRDCGLFETIGKELEALDVIRNKKVNLEYLKCCENYEQYKTICSYWNEITEKEFDLLKEVLL